MRRMVARECHDWLLRRLLLATAPLAFSASSALLLVVCPVPPGFYLGVAVLNFVEKEDEGRPQARAEQFEAQPLTIKNVLSICSGT